TSVQKEAWCPGEAQPDRLVEVGLDRSGGCAGIEALVERILIQPESLCGGFHLGNLKFFVAEQIVVELPVLVLRPGTMSRLGSLLRMRMHWQWHILENEFYLSLVFGLSLEEVWSDLLTVGALVIRELHQRQRGGGGPPDGRV